VTCTSARRTVSSPPLARLAPPCPSLAATMRKEAHVSQLTRVGRRATLHIPAPFNPSKGALSADAELGPPVRRRVFLQAPTCPAPTDGKEASRRSSASALDFDVKRGGPGGLRRFTKDTTENKSTSSFAKPLDRGCSSPTPTRTARQASTAVRRFTPRNRPIGNPPARPPTAARPSTGVNFPRGSSSRRLKDHSELIGSVPLCPGHSGPESAPAHAGQSLDRAAQDKAMGRRNFGLHSRINDNEAKT